MTERNDSLNDVIAKIIEPSLFGQGGNYSKIVVDRARNLAERIIAAMGDASTSPANHSEDKLDMVASPSEICYITQVQSWEQQTAAIAEAFKTGDWDNCPDDEEYHKLTNEVFRKLKAATREPAMVDINAADKVMRVAWDDCMNGPKKPDTVFITMAKACAKAWGLPYVD